MITLVTNITKQALKLIFVFLLYAEQAASFHHEVRVSGLYTFQNHGKFVGMMNWNPRSADLVSFHYVKELHLGLAYFTVFPSFSFTKLCLIMHGTKPPPLGQKSITLPDMQFEVHCLAVCLIQGPRLTAFIHLIALRYKWQTRVPSTEKWRQHKNKSAHLTVIIPPLLVNHCAPEHWTPDQAEECRVLKNETRWTILRSGVVSCRLNDSPKTPGKSTLRQK